jgi:TetR/AcrR family transcriptional regulator
MTEALSRRTRDKRDRIIETAMRHFASRGYHAARIEDMARELAIAKGSVFQHFGSKQKLFLAAYERAVSRLPAYQDAPEAVRSEGFFATLRYWLARTEHLVREDWIPYRMTLLGNYGTDLALRREINRFLLAEDPYGNAAFVREGLERGELRSDVDRDLIASILDWTVERFQDALLTEELDPGLFRRHGSEPERTAARIDEFLDVLRGAIGARETGGGTRRARPPGGRRARLQAPRARLRTG